jgi:hypothetical protein
MDELGRASVLPAISIGCCAFSLLAAGDSARCCGDHLWERLAGWQGVAEALCGLCKGLGSWHRG